MIAFLSVLTVSLLLGFIILFEGSSDNFSIWWKELTRDSESLPGSPYKERRVDSDDVHFEKSNEVIQNSLRVIVEKGSNTSKIIFVTNKINKIILSIDAYALYDSLIKKIFLIKKNLHVRIEFSNN